MKEKRMTYEDIFYAFKNKYPFYATRIDDYRPSKYGDGITVWIKDENKTTYALVVKYNKETDEFVLLDGNQSYMYGEI